MWSICIIEYYSGLNMKEIISYRIENLRGKHAKWSNLNVEEIVHDPIYTQYVT
jgi:hypothetical protein